MKISAIAGLLWLALAATAFGQAKSSSNPAGPVQSKASLAEVREIVHELEGRTERLRELLSNHRSIVENRPESEEQQVKWESALERSLVRVESARAALVETTERLDKAITGELPTGLAKDVARVRNEAEPQRAMAEQVLAKKPAPRKAKPAKPAKATEKPAPPSDDELDL